MHFAVVRAPRPKFMALEPTAVVVRCLRVARLVGGVACHHPEAALEERCNHRGLADKDADAVFAH